MLVYCVEDDSSIRELIVYTLEQTGFTARGFAEATSFFTAIVKQQPDIIILDIMLPDIDGLTILTKLRMMAETKAIPVIMATAKGTEFDAVSGLNAGADDYVIKPFGMMELVARIHAVLRRTNKTATTANLACGSITIDEKKHRVFVEKERVEVTAKEFQLLKELMMYQGQVLSREQLLLSVWGYDYEGETRTVDVHIRTLRQKLQQAGTLIRTVHGVGYCLEAQDEA